MSDLLFPIFSDELLSRAVAAAPVEKGGGWAELFLERSETLRGEWSTRRGVRILPGVREGFALRRVGTSLQRHVAVEGLDPGRVLDVCRDPSRHPAGAGRSGRPAADSPKERNGSPGDQEGEPEEIRSLATALLALSAEFARGLAGSLPPSPDFSLILERRRRSVAVASSGHRPVRAAATRAALTCRIESSSGEVVFGAGAEDLGPLLERNTAGTLLREIVGRREAAREAREVPEGERVVVLAPGTGGVFFHEACGHALEGDLVLQGRSVFRDLLGEKVAPPFVGAMDDSSQPGLEGSYSFDDEGSPCRGTVLIAGGKLKAFLTDRITGGRLGRGTTGNGRRESFLDPPLPRMSNTFLMAGSEDPAEILRKTPRGIFVRWLDGGRVDPGTGSFLFRAGSGNLIEEGRLTAPLRPFSIAGDSLAALRGIEAVGWNLDFGTGAGSCGKEGQKIPVAVGQPTLRLRSLSVRAG